MGLVKALSAIVLLLMAVGVIVTFIISLGADNAEQGAERRKKEAETEAKRKAQTEREARRKKREAEAEAEGKATAEEEAKRKKKTKENRTTGPSQVETKFAKTLDLKGKITKEDIQKNYRDLIQKYHPDKVEHLGDEFKELARVKAKEIIEAYEYFRKKHEIE